MTIRKAVEKDIPEIKRLYRILYADMAALQPEYWRETCQSEAFLKKTITESISDVFIADRDGEVMGFALVQEEDTEDYPALIPYRICYLMDLLVAPGARGAGAGSKLLAAVEAWANERGLAYLELDVLEENRGAARLYERCGYRDVRRTMRKKLRP